MNPICNWVLFQCVYFSLHFTSFSSLMSLCLVTMSTTLMLFCLFSTLLPSPTPQLSHQVAAEVEPVRHPAPSINICLKIEKLSVDGELIAHNYVKIAVSEAGASKTCQVKRFSKSHKNFTILSFITTKPYILSCLFFSAVPKPKGWVAATQQLNILV